MMNKKILGAILGIALSATLSAGYKKTEEIYRNDFDTKKSLSDWCTNPGDTKTQGTPEVLKHWRPKKNGKGGYLHFKVVKHGESDWINLVLPPDKMKGLIQIEMKIRGKNLVQGDRVYFGPKIMLQFKANGIMNYPEPDNRPLGTYDWKKTGMLQLVPEATTEISLALGIQAASGEFDIDDLRIYRCEESDEEVTDIPVNQEALKIPRGPGKGTRYRGVMSGCDLSPEAFQTLADWNVNLIRYQVNAGIQVNTGWVNRDISTKELYLKWIDDEIRNINENILPLAEKHGIKIIVDLHTGPNTKINAVASNVLTTETNMETLVEAWKRLARNFKGNPMIYGYDILNEPVATDETLDKWQTIIETVVPEIRKIDPETPIIIEPCASIASFDTGLKPIKAKNIIYSPHFYEPFSYTHQGVFNRSMGEWLKYSYPGYINGTYWDKEQLRVSVKSTIEFQRKYNVPIFVGEFSAVCWAKGSDKYIADMIEIMEEYGWDWTLHAFREWDGWSVEHEGSPEDCRVVRVENPRKQVFLKALKKNQPVKNKGK